MSTVPEAVGRRPAVPAAPSPHRPPPAPTGRARFSRAAAGERARSTWSVARYPLAVYAATRLLYLLIALADTRLQGWHLGWEVSNWDGFWYLLVVADGYPDHVMHNQSTLGFLPLYPLLMLAGRNLLHVHPVVIGMIISGLTGAVATVMAGRLAASWWDEPAGRRAVLFFCLFPGSIVFSMLYTEGLLLMLVMGCLLALQHRRWVLAGILAGLSTAVGPVAVPVIFACAAAAVVEVRSTRNLRALAAPLLAPAGIAAFGVYLWIHAGTPFASYTAQRYGWHEESSPLALWRTTMNLVRQLEHLNLNDPHLNLNLVAGIAGAAFLAVGLRWLWRERQAIPLPVAIWTGGVTLLIVTSAQTPPNPRMLIVCFPVLLAFAHRYTGRAQARLLAASTVLLVAMSLVTYVGTGLRP